MTLAGTSLGQRASNWRVYTTMDGLPEPSCISVNVTPHGKVLATHLNKLFVTELDGYSVRILRMPETGGTRVYASPGGQLWAPSQNGLLEFRDGAWISHVVPAITASFSQSARRPMEMPLVPIRQGLVLALLPDQLMEYDTEEPDHPATTVLRRATQLQLGAFSGLCPAHDGGLWLAGDRGLAKVPPPLGNVKPDSSWVQYLAPAALQIDHLQDPHEDSSGMVTAIAEDSGNRQRAIVTFNGERWTRQDVGAEKIRHAWSGPDQTHWAASIDSLFQWREGEPGLSENEEVSARQYYDLAIQPDGIFWLATSEGLFRYAPPAWRSPRSLLSLHSLVRCLDRDGSDAIWFVSGACLHRLHGAEHQAYSFPRGFRRELETARKLFCVNEGLVLVETENRLFQFDAGKGAFAPIRARDGGAGFRILGAYQDGQACLQELDGSATNQPYRLKIYDGAKFLPLPAAPLEPVLGSSLSAFYRTRSGDFWLAGASGAALYHEGKWKTFVSSDETTPTTVLEFTELADGRIWCATDDKIWDFDGRNWSPVEAGFDRVNDLVKAHDGTIWVGANSGIYRFTNGTWVQNGIDEGLPMSAVREVCEDLRGRIWAGTTRGLSCFDPNAPDTDHDPPRTRIRPLRDDQKNIPEGGTITLSFIAIDKWKYTPQNRLLYSYRLDERDWSSFRSENTVSFTDLPPGKHYFQVRAMDRNCNVEGPQTAKVQFSVILPWYREPRLLSISIAGALAALFFAGLAFNRHLRLMRSYAEVERKVAQRTRELEAANRELLQSQKMTALGTLAAGVAHDFNNILSIVKGSAQLIEENLHNPAKIRTRLERIKTVVEQGSGIVKAMLGFSRDSGQQTELCEINTVVENTVKLLGDRFLRDVQVRFEPGSGLPSLSTSRDFVQQILLNFIFNAGEAMTKPKSVILATGRMDKLPDALILMPAQAADYVSISVRDFGCGIPPENLSRIFEPFFTTKALSARRGTGLGLSMVYELARKMGAGLAVESIVNEGSTFILILPVRNQPPAPPPASSTEPDHQHDTPQSP